MEFKQPTTVEEYMQMVKSFSWLVDVELKTAEAEISANFSPSLVQMVPKLISLVNVIGYMRGQDGVFLDSRPAGMGDFQNELYKNEDSFEGRLHELIVKVCGTAEGAVALKTQIEGYYIRNRVPHGD